MPYAVALRNCRWRSDVSTPGMAKSAAMAEPLTAISRQIRGRLGVATMASKDPRAPWHQALGDKRGSVLRS